MALQKIVLHILLPRVGLFRTKIQGGLICVAKVASILYIIDPGLLDPLLSSGDHCKT